MCIICNLTTQEDPHGGSDKASKFLSNFNAASVYIKRTTDSMLECANHAGINKVVSRRYKATHKKMVKLLREFNNLEQYRENAVISIYGDQHE